MGMGGEMKISGDKKLSFATWKISPLHAGETMWTQPRGSSFLKVSV